MATDETKPNNGYNSCFNSKHSDLISSRKKDAMNERFRGFFQSLATVKMSEYITEGGERIGAGEWTSVYVRWFENASQIALFRLSAREVAVCRNSP